MNLKEAELFYKKYRGSQYQMYREDPVNYGIFRQLEIDEELKKSWQDEIDEELEQLRRKRNVKHLYVHVPFCSSICYYCDFCHRIYDEKLADKWLERLSREAQDNCFNQYETIYIGGGTPSCLDLRQLKKLLNIIIPYSNEVKEYTIEINPDSFDEERLKLFKEYGINRISIGVQSGDDEILRSLNRKHSYDDVIRCVEMLKKNGLENISVDLMYSLPGQNTDILSDSIDKILKLDVPHISIYSLTIEENTVFGRNNVRPLDEDTEADMYELIVKKLEDNGYIHYEVANFAKEGYESKHNMSYWNYDDFIGLSLGASSKIGNHRYSNTRSFERYFNDENILDEDLHLDKEELMFENIMMSLRTIHGLDIEEFNQRYGCDLVERYKKGLANKHIEIIDGRLICTDLEILNSVLLDFMD